MTMRSPLSPTLDLLLADPAKMADLPLETVEALLGQCAVVHGRLQAAQAKALAQGNGSARDSNGQVAETDSGAFSPKEVADLLHLNVRHVHQLIRQRRLPAYKVGRLWRIPKAEFQEWVERRKNGLDGGSNTMLPLVCDETRGSAHQARPGTLSVQIRRAPGCAQVDGPPMGSGALPRERSRRKADSAARRAAEGLGEA